MAFKSTGVPTGHRLQALRCLMEEYGFDFYIVPQTDAHASEYISNHDARRAFISGFTGSAGHAIITKTDAFLFTDGRYFLQASIQLDKNWTLMKVGLPGVPTWQDWIVKQAKDEEVVGVDASLISFNEATVLSKKLREQSNAKLVGSQINLIDKIWVEDRPKKPCNPLIVHPFEFAGEYPCSKIKKLRLLLEEKNAFAFLVTMLDEIAWMLNLRGSDIDYNPVFYAYLLVTHDNVVFYVDQAKLDVNVKEHLRNIEIKCYENIIEDLSNLRGSLGSKKVILSNEASWALAIALGETNVEVMRSPVADAKVVKNEIEMNGMRNCHIRDGVALVKFFAWLEEFLKNGGVIDEVDAATKLELYRREQCHFVDLSFPTISSTGKNCAIIHYKPEKSSCSYININQIYLCDSGAQYRDGTTDVTRTYHFGAPTEKEKQTFTLVLKGHIAIANLIFPKGITGYTIDILARQFLWNIGLDYLHGTGHGIGSFLNVHEPPIGIAQRALYNELPFVPGMIVSDEPGFYEEECYGQRIESIILVKKADTPYRFPDRDYYGFEYLTMCPIGLNLINVDMLEASEKKWLNDYHLTVFNKIGPYLQDDLRALEWLKKETLPI